MVLKTNPPLFVSRCVIQEYNIVGMFHGRRGSIQNFSKETTALEEFQLFAKTLASPVTLADFRSYLTVCQFLPISLAKNNLLDL